MEVRLNKLISDSGLCSRREADKFIEEGRVTVNGSLPHIGQKVTEADIVMLDDIQVRIGKHTGKQTSSARINIQELELAGQEKKAKKTKPSSTATSEKKATSPAAGSKGLRPGKYVKYNRSHVFSLLFCCVIPKGIFRPKGQEIRMRASENELSGIIIFLYNIY